MSWDIIGKCPECHDTQGLKQYRDSCSVDREGNFCVNFRAICDCGFRYSFNHSEKALNETDTQRAGRVYQQQGPSEEA